MFKALLTRFIKDERGVTAIEYGVLGIAIATALIVVFSPSEAGADSSFMTAIKGLFTQLSETVAGD